MQSERPAGPPRPRAEHSVPRRGPLTAEIALLALFALADAAPLIMEASPQAPHGIATSVLSGFGLVAAVLAVLRRRLAGWIGVLGGGVIAFSLADTAVTLLMRPSVSVTPGLAETLAIALLVGAGCRRLGMYAAGALAVAGGVAMTAAPILRYGPGSDLALLAVPAALMWGGSLAVGFVLRDADDRRFAALAEVRTAERLRLARELHDFVAHHVTGIVVRAQAARVLAEHPDPEESHGEVYRDIEEAASDALSAMRKLVGMLRTDTDTGTEALPAAAGIRAAVRGASSGHAAVVTDLPEELDRLTPAPEIVNTVHRVVLEAVTNVRRHAPKATEVRVSARVQHDPAADVLALEIVNDGVTGTSGDGSGYGLIGMTERVTALGGTIRAGAESGKRWRIAVILPLRDRIVPGEATR